MIMIEDREGIPLGQQRIIHYGKQFVPFLRFLIELPKRED